MFSQPLSHRPQRVLAAVTLAAGLCLSGAGVASAQSVDARNNTTPIGPTYNVNRLADGTINDPFLTGPIPLEYLAGGGCTTAAFHEEGTPREGVQVFVRQVLPPSATDPWLNPLDWRKFVRTNDSLTLTWTNTSTGRTGVAQGKGTGFDVGGQFDSGPGEVRVRAELTSSALPPLPGGSIEQPFVERAAQEFTLTVAPCA